MALTAQSAKRLAEEYEEKTPQDVLALAFEHYENITIAFSGAEDVALIDMAVEQRKNVSVFCLDTGRLHPETYRFIAKVNERYGLKMDVLFPDAAAVQKLVREKGLFSFYEDGHAECCSIRKVGPLKRKLKTVDAWVTGQRRDQSPATRALIPVVEQDRAFSTPERPLFKFNPMATWTSERVWRYVRERDLPINELHRKGFVSIGCEPCTRPVLPNQHERAGRWWWEEATKKECGLHVARDDVKSDT